jgi:hypothetical protein
MYIDQTIPIVRDGCQPFPDAPDPPFTAANNMVTPKMSIRRHVVVKPYEDVISDLYERCIEEGGHLPREKKLEAA